MEPSCHGCTSEVRIQHCENLSKPRANTRRNSGDFSNSRAAGMENPSYIVKIDNMPAYEYLDNLTTIAGGTHDKDAGFNMLFPGLTKLAMGVELTDYFSMGSYYELPDESSVELANGTVFTFPNIAVMGYDIRTVTTPDDLHKLVELGITPRAGGGFFGGRKEKREKKMDIRDMEKRQRAWPQPVQQQALCPEQHGQNQRPDFWPKPFDQVMDKYAGGFFLEGEGYNDVAVLEINSFASPFLSGQYPGCNVQEMTEYHRFLKSFVTKFRQQGKKKLVIDLSVNGGGWEVTLTDTFDQLFPGKVPGFSYRVRATKAMEWILDATYDVTAQGKTLGGDSLLMDLHKNWPKSFGPVPINGDNFTDTVFRSTLDERHSMGLDDTALKDPLVDPKNIVIITDGACHSSCALIVGWFTREMGIRTVLFGGRPHTAPVQAIGGTKGGAVFPWDNYQIMTLIGQMATGTDGPPGANLPSTQNNGVVFTAPMVVGDQSINSMEYVISHIRPGTPQVSFVECPSNAILSSSIWHNFTVPVQFQWEAANCRLFYTEATWQNIDSMWKAAADVAWKGAKCAPGSTSNADGTMGDKVPAFKYAAIRPNEVFKKGSKRDVDPRAPRDVRHLQGRPASEIEKLVDQGPMLWINRQQRTKGVLGGLKIDPNLAPLEQAGATAQAAGRPAPAQS